MRLLLVEDDELLAQTLLADLTSQHYIVDVATDGEMGWNYAQSVTYDLILLDVSLPKRDGISLCRQLRDRHYQGPILLLTAHLEDSAKVRGLDAGADDYVIKPCTVQELCARIRALLRRRDAFSTPMLIWGDLCLDPSACEVTFQERLLSLSPKEYSLLELFLRHPRRIFSSSAILDHLWSFEEVPGEDTVRAHIKRLRKKLREVGAEDLIETVYGMGYRLKSLEPKVEPPSQPEQIRSTVAQAWDSLKVHVLERVALLNAFLKQPASEILREEAKNAAHKLAGSLGMFGFADGSLLGREIETILKQWNEKPQIAKLARLVQQLETALEKSPSSLKTQESAVYFLDESYQLLLIGQDAAFEQKLQILETSAKMQIYTVIDLAKVEEQIEQRSPHLLLFDLPFANQTTNGLIFLEELATQYPNLPILVLTDHEEFFTRLEVARRGGTRLLSKSLTPEQFLAIIKETLSPNPLTDTKVLVVDDDPLLLEALQQLLPAWGLQLTILDDPRQFWETLSETAPDILLLDVEMPHINGIELCQVVRNDHHWDHLPILFLTSRRDKDSVHRLFSAGADDYINKPFAESELMTRIFNRLKRNRLLKNIQYLVNNQ